MDPTTMRARVGASQRLSPATTSTSAVLFTRASGVVWKTYGEARKRPPARSPARILPECLRAATATRAAASTPAAADTPRADARRSEEHTSELQSHSDLVCRLLLEKKK